MKTQEITDPTELIKSEFEAAKQEADGVPEEIGMFSIKTANRTIQEAAARPNPEKLWLELWYKGEVCCLFSDSNLGKSIYAVQIATEISKTEKVLYFDFELSDKQFQLRYTDEDTNQLFAFPETLYRVELNPEKIITNSNFEDAIIGNIEFAAIETGAKVLIIDNLTYLCIAAEKGDLAGSLMIRLMALKKKYGFSILILAHTPKRILSNPITQNDLAGSKKLYNFFDSVFAIGKSAKDSNLRYIKQLKVRHGSFTYDSDNVIVYSIDKIDAFTKFVFVEYSEERQHLNEMSFDDKTNLENNIKELHQAGNSVRKIADKLNVSKSKVNRIINKSVPSVPSVPLVSVGTLGTAGQQLNF